jgi:hypothetical protein
MECVLVEMGWAFSGESLTQRLQQHTLMRNERIFSYGMGVGFGKRRSRVPATFFYCCVFLGQVCLYFVVTAVETDSQAEGALDEVAET